MAKHVQELINKIKQEGFQAAQQKTREIESAAQDKAKAIVLEAQVKAEGIISDAKRQAERLEHSARISLQQASRNTLLDLKKQIEAVLQAIIAQEIRASLNTETVGHMITSLVEDFNKKGPGEKEVRVTLNKKDFEALKEGFLAKLQKEIKTKVHLVPSGETAAGFTISFDGGRSSFDFTDESLANYLSLYLNEEVGRLLRDTSKG